MGYKFNWELPKYSTREIEEIKNKYNLSDITSKILLSKNIKNSDEIQSYLSGEYEEGFDPFLLYDMKKVVDRINYAIEKEEKILVYGDYDADGITSTVLLLETLISLGANVSSYIPNRFTEGYGPNKDAFEKIIKSGISLIITVDNGIAGVDEVKIAKNLGCDVIITDHHKVQDDIPDAYAIIHPEHPKGNYPFKKLAGVGVAFKLAHALLEIYPEFLLDLVAIGTIADLVPLTSENRIFVKQGLSLLNEDTRVGIKLLLDIANHTGKIDEQTIGFVIAPRLNAIGRMSSAKEGLIFLSSENIKQVQELALIIDNYNSERKKVTEDIINDIEKQIKKYKEKSVIVVYSENYHEGVLGIASSFIAEKYKKPTFIMNLSNNKLKGSARSVNNFNIYEAINNIGELFLAYGGHTMAAGFSIDLENIDLVEQELCSIYNKHLENNVNYVETKKIDLIFSVDDISYQSLGEIELLKPFGVDFDNPIILIENITVLNKIKFGNENQYLKLLLGDKINNIEAISFKDNDIYENIEIGDNIDIIFNLSKNNFNGRIKLQLQLIDINKKQYLFKDSRNIKIDINNLNIEDLKLSTTYSDKNNNYYKYSDLKDIDLIGKYKNIHILDIPDFFESINKIISLNADSINLICNKQDFLYSSYQINKESLINLFNIVIKHKEIALNINNITKLSKMLSVKIDSLKLMIKIFLELNLITIINNKIIFNNDYKNINLEKSKTYKYIKEKMELENLFLNENIKTINEKLLDK